MNEPLQLSCDCGAFSGVIDPQGLKGYRAICLCDDCQAYARFLGRADILDQNGGTDVIPLTPAKLKFTKGEDHLQCLRLSENGMFRWYTDCCKTPIANTMNATQIPYVGFISKSVQNKNTNAKIEANFGPVLARINGRDGYGILAPNTSKKAPLAFILRVLKFIFLATIRGQKKPSPFADLIQTRKIRILTQQELAHAKALRPST